jgi:pimeloyl-ACP methyl ester carboxylesterase
MQTRIKSSSPSRAYRRLHSLAFGVVVAVTLLIPARLQADPRIAAAFDAASFWKTFHHGTVSVNGVRLHYVEGGSGAPLLLIPGWPESWYAWRHVMPALAAGRRVVVIDPRGMGDSGHPASGYDLKTVAADVHGLVEALALTKDGPIDVAGHDVGAWIGYAYGSDWPGDVKRLALFDAALPGVTPPAPAGIPTDAANVKSWHFAFNRLDDLPELLVQGREREYLTWLFQNKASKTWAIGAADLDEYVRVYRQPGAVRAGFAYYRAAFGSEGLAQSRARAQHKLSMPVLAIGAEFGVGDNLVDVLRSAASNVSGGTARGCGHFVPEECPEVVIDDLKTFFK